jgi:hypothetical protein
MLSKKIEFFGPKEITEVKNLHPVPIKFNLPDWFKKLEHKIGFMTVKGCVPFLETLTTGYLLKIPKEFKLKHNVFNSNNERETEAFYPSHKLEGTESVFSFFNLNHQIQVHNTSQIKGSPHEHKNKELPVQKILNPWTIKTPPGYSCMFLPPLNNTDDRFSIIPGIVNTDTFQNNINFPYIVNGDKYPYLDEVIKEGTPYVQVIPFKRNDWKMSIGNITKKEMEKRNVSSVLKEKILHTYRNIFWRKSQWN